jgi:hypothetical protein
MDWDEVARDWKGKITFWVGMDVQDTLINGTPEDVRREVRLMRDTFDSPEGGFIYAAGNGIVGGTPIENIEAFLEEILVYRNEQKKKKPPAAGGFLGYFMIKPLEHNIKSYIKIFLIGIFVGCATRLLDYFPPDTLWGFSSIQTLLGFWMITNTIIVLSSSSNICAALSSFLYMFGMTLSFYGLQAILGLFIPLFSGVFRLSLFLMFTALSIPCAAAAYILYFWNKDNNFNSVLYALPIGALFAEAAAIFVNLMINRTYLFQLLMDIAGGGVFAALFWKRAKDKRVYVICVAGSAVLFYFALYHREVAAWV